MALAVNSSAPRFGVNIAEITRFPAGNEDMTDAVTTFTHYSGVPQNPQPFQAALLPFAGRQVRSAAEMMTADGMPPGQVQRLGTGLWDDANLAKEPSLQGSWYAAPPPRVDDDFNARYRATFNAAPANLASLAYDAISLVALLAQGEPYHRFTQHALMDPNGFTGVDGIFRFTPDGQCQRGLAVLEFSPQGFSVIDPPAEYF